MLKNNAGYWFYIEPYVFVTKKKEYTLFFNGYSTDQIIVRNSDYTDLLTEIIDNEDNLRVIELTANDLNDLRVKKFVSSIRNKFMGDLLDKEYFQTKPVQNIQKPKIRHDVNILKDFQNHSVGYDNILEYIVEMSLYLNNECSEGCNYCKDGFKQFLCCTKNQNSEDNNFELRIDSILKLCKIIKNTSLTNINILGGNVFKYAALDELVMILNKLDIEINYYIHIKNIINANQNLICFKDGENHNKLKILIDNKLDCNDFTNINDYMDKLSINHEYIFIVQSEEDFNYYSEIIERLSLLSYNFNPFYNGGNIEFFEDNVYLNNEQLEHIKLTLKDIFANNELNKINFGRLVIFPNGNVHSNTNFVSLGNIDHDDIIDIVNKEIYEGISWLMPRKKKSPCNECIYESICPPISNYEYAIGKHNLCHIHDKLPRDILE